MRVIHPYPHRYRQPAFTYQEIGMSESTVRRDMRRLATTNSVTHGQRRCVVQSPKVELEIQGETRAQTPHEVEGESTVRYGGAGTIADHFRSRPVADVTTSTQYRTSRQPGQ
jgi:hypothetical protein